MERFLFFWNKYKLFIFAGLIGIAFIILFVVVFKKQTNAPVGQGSTPTPTTYPTTVSFEQKPFSITSVVPANGKTNVDAGEIEISFTTDSPIVSANSFSMEITPALPYYWKIINTYPTNTITAKVFGGLKTNTTYTLTVKNSSGITISTWSFTTSVQEGSSSSALVEEGEKRIIQKYQPLFYVTPYTSINFNLDYTNKLTLKVIIKNPDVAKVKQEVNDWIRSQGVDPSTHTINYINNF